MWTRASVAMSVARRTRGSCERCLFVEAGAGTATGHGHGIGNPCGRHAAVMPPLSSSLAPAGHSLLPTALPCSALS